MWTPDNHSSLGGIKGSAKDTRSSSLVWGRGLKPHADKELRGRDNERDHAYERTVKHRRGVGGGNKE